MEAPSLLFRLAGSTGQVIGKLASNTEAICSFLCTPIRTGGQFCSKTFSQTSEMADNLAKTASNLLSVLPEGTQVRGQHVSSCWCSLLCLLRTQMCFRLTCLSQQQRWLTQCRVLLSVTCQSRNCMSCSGMTNTQHVCRQVVSTSADKPCRAYTAVIARSTYWPHQCPQICAGLLPLCLIHQSCLLPSHLQQLLCAAGYLHK